MRVLWFTNTPSCYEGKGNDYNGGGWISSLEKELRSYCTNVKLGICFYYDGGEKTELENVTYYPINRNKKLTSLLKQFFYRREKASHLYQEEALLSLIKVVEDFRPDIIHVFGTENIFGALYAVVDIPIVLHIQGIIAPYLHAFLPPGVSWMRYIFSNRLIKSIFAAYREKLIWERNSITENRIYKGIQYFMGRTAWDKSVVSLINPQAKYYYCSEILRDVFYLPNKNNRRIPLKPLFVSIISWQIYKGMDLVLKAAALLKEFMGFDFEWHIYGSDNAYFAEKLTGINASDVNVVSKGVVNATNLKEAMQNSTAYIHTSYIENSSNAICEAQLSGCTCIATCVGGTASLIENGVTGFLVPANDPYRLAYLMKYIAENRVENEKIGNAAYVLAKKRHDKNEISAKVVEIYNDILERHK